MKSPVPTSVIVLRIWYGRYFLWDLFVVSLLSPDQRPGIALILAHLSVSSAVPICVVLRRFQ
eukprot:2189760-Rhodomonas_salina.2